MLHKVCNNLQTGFWAGKPQSSPTLHKPQPLPLATFHDTIVRACPRRHHTFQQKDTEKSNSTPLWLNSMLLKGTGQDSEEKRHEQSYLALDPVRCNTKLLGEIHPQLRQWQDCCEVTSHFLTGSQVACSAKGNFMPGTVTMIENP